MHQMHTTPEMQPDQSSLGLRLLRRGKKGYTCNLVLLCRFPFLSPLYAIMSTTEDDRKRAVLETFHVLPVRYASGFMFLLAVCLPPVVCSL